DSKFIALGPLAVPAATLLFPIAFILNDVLTEVYGYERSRRVIWTGMACQILAAVSFWIVGVLPGAPFWHNQQAYSTILGVVPRIALASLIAYLSGEFANSFVLSRMKYSQLGRRGLAQGWRFVASTLVGEALDSVVFMLGAFLGVLSVRDLLASLLTIYFLKVAVEVIALPGSTRLANWLKRVEAFDQLDDPTATRYNPFKLGVSGAG
ncbi:MAG TPA: queuosine precursor transporter, partial [Gemmatimonadales bacterium]|nr:queuosine precursor transporter [Gemmatimonadales bacterium]